MSSLSDSEQLGAGSEAGTSDCARHRFSRAPRRAGRQLGALRHHWRLHSSQFLGESRAGGAIQVPWSAMRFPYLPIALQMRMCWPPKHPATPLRSPLPKPSKLLTRQRFRFLASKRIPSPQTAPKTSQHQPIQDNRLIMVSRRALPCPGATLAQPGSNNGR